MPPDNRQRPQRPQRIAVIGSGISGLGAAWLLARHPDRFDVTLYEAGDYFGGHTHTVDVPALDPTDGSSTGVDTGFIVCNPVTYPNFLAFLEALKVKHVQSDMTFSVSRNSGQLEWAGDNLNTLFAQRENLFPLLFHAGASIGGDGSTFGIWGMAREIIRFHDQAKRIAEEADGLVFDDKGIAKDKKDRKEHPFAKMTLRDFFNEFKYTRFFYENYILPMTAAIWSTPADMAFDQFPLLTLVKFMRNHVLLQIGGRPKWRTIEGGSRTYVERVLESIKDARISTPVLSVTRSAKDSTLTVKTASTSEVHDHVIFATHADEALAILGDAATPAERAVLSRFKFVSNKAVLHRDVNLMPKRRLAWSSWNYMTHFEAQAKRKGDGGEGRICLSYWMNRLQPSVDAQRFGDVIVTLNPVVEPDRSKILGEWEYTHPLYTPDTVAAQEDLVNVQNADGVSFAGAWTNYGFHEDGLTSGLVAAMALGAECPFEVVLNGGYPTLRRDDGKGVVRGVRPARWAVKNGWVDVDGVKVRGPVYGSIEERRSAVRGIALGDRHGMKGKKSGGSSVVSSMLFFLSGVLLAIAVSLSLRSHT